MNPALPRLTALDLDFRRIAATSATIAVHVLAFMLLLAPMESAPPPARAHVVETPYIIDNVIPPPPPPPTEEPRTVTRTQAPRPQLIPEVMPQLDVAPIDYVVPDIEPIAAETDSFGTGDMGIGDPPSGPLPLTVLVGPSPTYPLQALRQGIQGRVILRIEVDANGVPSGGRIETSSGSTLLDRAALKFVIAKWRFEPAVHGGQPIAAVALVPVDFVINE